MLVDLVQVGFIMQSDFVLFNDINPGKKDGFISGRGQVVHVSALMIAKEQGAKL